MLVECLRAVAFIAIVSKKDDLVNILSRRHLQTLQTFSGHKCDVLATKINARKAKHWAPTQDYIDQFNATETKEKDWEGKRAWNKFSQ